MTSYADLERRYEGRIPQDEKDRADGIDPALMHAMGQVKFWRERVRNAKGAVEVTTMLGMSVPHAWLTETAAALERAETNLRTLQDRKENR